MNYRVPIVFLALSAAAAGALITDEGWMGTAAVPTKNDRCTVGFGSTFKEDGSPVKCGETITPVQAVKRSLGHIAKDEARLKKCVFAPMSQKEYDILVKFSYQYGVDATCKSSMTKHINAGNYAQACEAYTLYKMSGGFDCSTPGNQVCRGVWTRSLARKADCLAAQNDFEPTPAPVGSPATKQVDVPVTQKTWWQRVKEFFG